MKSNNGLDYTYEVKIPGESPTTQCTILRLNKMPPQTTERSFGAMYNVLFASSSIQVQLLKSRVDQHPGTEKKKQKQCHPMPYRYT